MENKIIQTPPLHISDFYNSEMLKKDFKNKIKTDFSYLCFNADDEDDLKMATIKIMEEKEILERYLRYIFKEFINKC